MNLIQSLGEEYFSGMCGNSVFLHNGVAWRIRGTTEGRVLCQALTGEYSGGTRLFSYDDFPGFRVFAYPELGYRRYNDNLVVYLSRIQSAHRGLREGSVAKDFTPLSRELVMNRYTQNLGKSNMEMAMLPEYDKPEDLKALRSGDKCNVVLSNAVVIEPSLTSDNDWYDVFYHQTIVGRMNGLGRFSFHDPQHEAVISPLLA